MDFHKLKSRYLQLVGFELVIEYIILGVLGAFISFGRRG